MACMTHECENQKCRKTIFNNDASPETCPACGSKMHSQFDEIETDVDFSEDE